jgi:hypothetical protein
LRRTNKALISNAEAKESFKKGQISAPKLQKMNTSGASSSGTKNASRDSIRHMNRETDYPEVYEADVDLWNPESSQKFKGTAYFQVTYEVLEWAQKKHPDVDYTHLDTDTALHRERGLLGQRLGVDSSDMSSFCLWGDNAPMFNSNDSLFLFLFSILGCVDMTRYWLCCFPKRFMCNCGCKGRCTFDSVLDVIVWQFMVGVRGKAPRKRHDGILFKDSKKAGGQRTGGAGGERGHCAKTLLLEEKKQIGHG